MKLTESSIPESLLLGNHIMYDANNILDNGYGTYDYLLRVDYATRISMYCTISMWREICIRFNKDDMSLGLSNALTQARILSETNHDSYSALMHPTIYYNDKIEPQDENTKYKGIIKYINNMIKNNALYIDRLYCIQIMKIKRTFQP